MEPADLSTTIRNQTGAGATLYYFMRWLIRLASEAGGADDPLALLFKAFVVPITMHGRYR